MTHVTHGFCLPPPPHPIIMGGIIWKFAKILWGQNVFSHLWRDKPLWGELKLYGGRVKFVTALSLFHLFRNSIQKSKVFLLWNSLGNVNASGVAIWRFPTYSNLLKTFFRKASFCVLTKTTVMEKVLSSPHISNYYCIVVIKILEKYLLRSSLLEMNF